MTVPTPALRAPPPAPPPATPFVPGEPARIAFLPGSALLPEGAADTLRRLAQSRSGRDVVVVGHGESPGDDAATQADALALAFARARGMAAVLAQSGVGPGAIRLTAEAIGRGGVARVAE